MVQQLDEALRMLDTFASVGATHFDLTHIDIDGEERGFRGEQSLAQVKNSMQSCFQEPPPGKTISSCVLSAGLPS